MSKIYSASDFSMQKKENDQPTPQRTNQPNPVTVEPPKERDRILIDTSQTEKKSHESTPAEKR